MRTVGFSVPATVAASAFQIFPAEIAALKSSPNAVPFRAYLDANLAKFFPGAYESSSLISAADYALGYAVFGDERYADKAIGIGRSAFRDYLKDDSSSRQFIGMGDGATKSFDPGLPNITQLTVLGSGTADHAVVRATGNVDHTTVFDSVFVSVSLGPNGTGTNYVRGVDWIRDDSQTEDSITWIGNRPADGSTYHVVVSPVGNWTGLSATVSGTKIVFATAPAAGQALFANFVYGVHAADYSTLAYQQSGAFNGGGFNNVYIDSNYTTRYLAYLAVVLDWLWNYPGFAAAERESWRAMLVKWSDYARDNGFHTNDLSSNYGTGTFFLRAMTALAIEGRGPDSRKAEIITFRNTYSPPLLTGNFAGGLWGDGLNYSALATVNWMRASLAMEEAGWITANEERAWCGDAIRAIATAHYDGRHAYDFGDGYSFPFAVPNLRDLCDVLGWATGQNLCDVLGWATGQKDVAYLLATYDATSPVYGNIFALFHDSTVQPATDFTRYPLAMLATGTGITISRKDWSNASTWWATSGNRVYFGAHSADPGSLEINRGADILLCNAVAFFGGPNMPVHGRSIWGNYVVCNAPSNIQTYPWNQGVWYGPNGCPVSQTVGSNYTLTTIDYTASWFTPSMSGGPCKSAVRQIVDLGNDVLVVRDYFETFQASYAKELHLHCLNQPTVNGTVWTATKGNSKLVVQTFADSPVSLVSASVAFGTKSLWRQTIAPINQVAAVTFTTVFQSLASGTTPAVPGYNNGVVTVGTHTVTFNRDGTVTVT